MCPVTTSRGSLMFLKTGLESLSHNSTRFSQRETRKRLRPWMQKRDKPRMITGASECGVVNQNARKGAENQYDTRPCRVFPVIVLGSVHNMSGCDCGFKSNALIFTAIYFLIILERAKRS